MQNTTFKKNYKKRKVNNKDTQYLFWKFLNNEVLSLTQSLN